MCYSAMVHQNISTLLKTFNATQDHNAFEQYALIVERGANTPKTELKKSLGLARVPTAPLFRWAPDEMQRLYPNYFAPVMVLQAGQRTFVPMRYRVRPNGSATEIPSKYNVFNARIDSLSSRQTWRGLFGCARHHALFPFIRFYEWVERGGRKIEVAFTPQDYEVMWAPALYDRWSSADGRLAFESFAMITDEPPAEVAAAGHDRCPIFLDSNVIDDWLSPEKFAHADLYAILNQRQAVVYRHERTA